MPSIRRNEAQQRALSEVSDALATLKALNHALLPDWSGVVTVNFETGGAGRNKFARLCFGPGDKEVTDLLKMAQKQKVKMVKEINAKASKHAIKLDREDRLIMGPAELAVGQGGGLDETAQNQEPQESGHEEWEETGTDQGDGGS